MILKRKQIFLFCLALLLFSLRTPIVQGVGTIAETKEIIKKDSLEKRKNLFPVFYKDALKSIADSQNIFKRDSFHINEPQDDTSIFFEVDKKGGEKNIRENSEKSEYTQSGIASFYGERFRGRRTSSGERFVPDSMTAAHRSLPFGTMVRVYTETDSIDVRITDRGPFIKGRILDLSSGAFSRLENLSRGLIRVKIKVINQQ